MRPTDIQQASMILDGGDKSIVITIIVIIRFN